MFTLTQDFMIGSRVGRASREICAILFDHFFSSLALSPQNLSDLYEKLS